MFLEKDATGGKKKRTGKEKESKHESDICFEIFRVFKEPLIQKYTEIEGRKEWVPWPFHWVAEL